MSDRFEFVRYEKRGRIAWVTLDRPEVMNALHPPCHDELERIWDDFAADPEVWVAILTGAGERAFSAGNDLKWTAQHGGKMPPMPPGGFAGLTARFDLTKPVIGAVNGFALGGGFEIALCCDVLVAAEHARFGLPEPKVGLMAAAGGAQRLPRQLPLKIAMAMMLTGEPIDARRALELGLVNEVVPMAELAAAAERWASRILECSPLSVRATKQAAMDSLDRPLREAIGIQNYPAVLQLLRSEDALEGPRAFAEKRKPSWKGK
ncbi:MAG TPA: enoyl-CoA hydratase-related protein [Candidatus Binatia bacterium]|nr:enoyl-CoA hydratase-related protein [Candidatus Binatia bacterium]